MAKEKIICFYIGDLKIDYNEYIVLDSKDLNAMISKNILNKTYVVNVKELGLRANDIKLVIENAINPIIFVFDKLPEYHKDYKDKIELIDKSDNIDYMKIIELLLFEKDRNKVLKILNENNIAYESIIKWFYGCYNKFCEDNLVLLDMIDNMIYKAKPEYINVLLSNMKPEKKPYNIWQFLGKYKFKKEI